MAAAACARHVNDRKPKPFILPLASRGMWAAQTKPTGASSACSSASVTPNGRFRTMMRQLFTCIYARQSWVFALLLCTARNGRGVEQAGTESGHCRTTHAGTFTVDLPRPEHSAAARTLADGLPVQLRHCLERLLTRTEVQQH